MKNKENEEKVIFAYKNNEPNEEGSLEKMHEVIVKEAEGPNSEENEKENFK